MPTPAALAISSLVAAMPRSANTASATSSSRSWLRRASARSGRGSFTDATGGQTESLIRIVQAESSLRYYRKESPMTGELSPTEVFDRLIQGISEGRWHQLADLYAEDVVVDMPMDTRRTRIEGKEAVRRHFSAAANGSLEL